MDFFDLDRVRIDHSLPLSELLQSVERQIATADVEVSFVFDAAGQLLFKWSTSEAGQVRFLPSQLWQMANAYLTHNHPAQGGLSAVDIALAHEHNLAEIRAAAGSLVHQLTRPPDGWRTQHCLWLYVTGMDRAQKRKTPAQRRAQRIRLAAQLVRELSLTIVVEPL